MKLTTQEVVLLADALERVALIGGCGDVGEVVDSLVKGGCLWAHQADQVNCYHGSDPEEDFVAGD